MDLLLHPHHHQVPLLLLLEGKLDGLFISAAVTGCFTVCLCISPDMVRAPQDEDLYVCVYQKSSKRPIHTNWDDPTGRVDGGTGKEYEFQCACVEGNKTIKSVLNHGTDNTHGAYPADPSDGFPFTTAEKPDRVHSARTSGGQEIGPTSTDLQTDRGHIRNVSEIPKADFLQRPATAPAAKGENCEFMALVAVVHTAQNIDRSVACRTHCGGVTTPLVEVCPA